MVMSPRLPGHELAHEGAAYDTQGYRIYRGVSGVGYAKCSCGAKSPVLESGNQRKNWHREHKEQLRKESKP